MWVRGCATRPPLYTRESLYIFSSQDHCGGWRGLMMVSQVTGLAGEHIHLYRSLRVIKL